MEVVPNEIYPELFSKPLYVIPEHTSLKFRNLDGEQTDLVRLFILLKGERETTPSAADIDKLKKMAEWLGVGKREVVVHLMEETPLSFIGLNRQYHIENIIGYGCSPSDLDLQCEYLFNQPTRILNSRILFTAPFSEIQKNEKLKKEFFRQAEILFSHFKTIH